MSRPDSEKCRLCSKLTTPATKQRHGLEGDRCWNDAYCHNRRSYYRHRGVRNLNRKQRRQHLSQEAVGQTHVGTLSISVPATPAVVAYWYRETKTSPLHALGAELWSGNDRVVIEPVHCLGLT